MIQGRVDHAFAAVADAFGRNAGKGAAICVYHHGRKVVDLEGGGAWRKDALVPVLSTSKGLVAIVCAIAAAQGWLDYDVPVARIWPEFGEAGKHDVSVAALLNHEAGLPLFGRRVGLAELRQPEELAAALARQRPRWGPGQCGYHLATWGVLVGELLRRADAQGRRVGRTFADLVAAPLGADVHLGLPAGIADERFAPPALPGPLHALSAIPHLRPGLLVQMLNPLSLLLRAIGEVWGFDARDRRWLASDFPSANGVARVRDLARIYDAMTRGGAELGLTADVFARLTAPPADRGDDRVLGVPIRWHLGFCRPSSGFPFSPSPRAFGLGGFGGSFAFADPDAALAYAFAPLQLSAMPYDDPREQALRQAVYRSLQSL
jgi:CubicO group peptidase (beta-lactamase class C family)